MPQLQVENATIANGASQSQAIDLDGFVPVGLLLPSAWTAAAITFLASGDNTTFVPVYEADGTELTATASTSRQVVLDPAKFAGIRYLKLRSGTASAAVNQGADRVIGVISRPIG